MKIKLKDLVKDKYYHCWKSYFLQYYFKYNGHDNVKIYCNDYVAIDIYPENNTETHTFYDKKCYFCDISWYEESILFEEVDLKELVKYLPNNHPDKRKYKIDMLLAIK